MVASTAAIRTHTRQRTATSGHERVGAGQGARDGVPRAGGGLICWMDDLGRPEGRVAPAAAAHQQDVPTRPPPPRPRICKRARARQRCRRVARLYWGGSGGHGVQCGRTGAAVRPHSCRGADAHLSNGLGAMLAHGSQTKWPFEASSPRTGGSMRNATSRGRAQQPKPRATVEAACTRLRGEAAHGGGVLSGAKKGKDTP